MIFDVFRSFFGINCDLFVANFRLFWFNVSGKFIINNEQRS